MKWSTKRSNNSTVVLPRLICLLFPFFFLCRIFEKNIFLKKIFTKWKFISSQFVFCQFFQKKLKRTNELKSKLVLQLKSRQNLAVSRNCSQKKKKNRINIIIQQRCNSYKMHSTRENWLHIRNETRDYQNHRNKNCIKLNKIEKKKSKLKKECRQTKKKNRMIKRAKQKFTDTKQLAEYQQASKYTLIYQSVHLKCERFVTSVLWSHGVRVYFMLCAKP